MALNTIMVTLVCQLSSICGSAPTLALSFLLASTTSLFFPSVLCYKGMSLVRAHVLSSNLLVEEGILNHGHGKFFIWSRIVRETASVS